MRWLYADKNNPEEKERIIATEEKIQKWWKAFGDKQAEIIALLQGETQFDLTGWMKDNLNCIEENLMWEFRTGINKSYRLVISSQRNKALAPYISYMIKLAPELEEWEFSPFLSGQPFDKAADFVKDKTGVGVGNTEFKVDKGEHNTIKLTFTAADDNEKNAAMMATEIILGEEIPTQWISKIEFVQPAKKTLGIFKQVLKGFHEMEDLKFEATEHVQDIVEDILPQEEMFKLESAVNFNTPNWSAFKGEPNESLEDYPVQSDLTAGVSCCPEILAAVHSGIPFFSNRFSKFEEQFCYLKIEGTESFENSTFKDRSGIEETVHKAIMANESGCVIGGGTGMRYSYIELAIVDMDKALPEIKKILQDAKITNRSWLLFHDTNMLNEWVGIYDDSPEPPLITQ